MSGANSFVRATLYPDLPHQNLIGSYGGPGGALSLGPHNSQHDAPVPSSRPTSDPISPSLETVAWTTGRGSLQGPPGIAAHGQEPPSTDRSERDTVARGAPVPVGADVRRGLPD